MEIRPATESEIPILASLHAYVHDPHVQAEPERYRPTHREHVEARFQTVLESDATVVFLAVMAGEPVGYAVAEIIQNQGHTFRAPERYLLVDQIAVVSTNRRQGVGRVLMDAIDAHARDNGLDRVELDVRAHNRQALAFYESLGYAPVRWRMGRSV
jgi:ribosomal protein S18 acetylase RimI-like enzyme